MELFGGRLNLPYEFTYTLLASLSAVLTFATVKLNVRFSYYFYTITKNSSALLASKQGEERKRMRTLIISLYINFLFPIVVVLFYIQPLLQAQIVPDYLSNSIFRIIRITFVVFAICLRIMTYRQELQFVFNESYYLVQKLMIEKNEKVFRYIKLRIQESFLNTWYTIYQQSCNLILPMILLLTYVHRLVSFLSIPVEN